MRVQPMLAFVNADRDLNQFQSGTMISTRKLYELFFLVVARLCRILWPVNLESMWPITWETHDRVCELLDFETVGLILIVNR